MQILHLTHSIEEIAHGGRATDGRNRVEKERISRGDFPEKILRVTNPRIESLLSLPSQGVRITHCVTPLKWFLGGNRNLICSLARRDQSLQAADEE